MPKTKIKKLLLGVALLLVAIQFIRPEASNPPVIVKLDAPPAVAAIIGRSCRDCHTHNTVWPWYSQVAPVSWLVRDDVNSGRRKLNFSKFAPDPHELSNICKEISSGDMPLPIYVWIHPSAKLSPAEVKTICDWTREESR
jgi:Haem-binding domain